MGVPREKIPWAPTIDYAKCDFCMECDEFCPHQVFERREGDVKLVVANPEQLRGLLPGLRQDLRPGRDLLPRQAGDHRADQEDPRGGGARQ